MRNELHFFCMSMLLSFGLAFLMPSGIQHALATTATSVNFTPGTTPTTVATFNCISVYWKPSGGSSSVSCAVQYKPTGSDTWHTAQNLWYDATTYADHNMVNSYRSSIVNLMPNTQYDIKLTLSSGTTSTVTETTWNENFPVASTISVSGGSSTYTTTTAGSASGYVVYDGNGATINVNKGAANCLVINKSYVIIRNFVFIGSTSNAISVSSGASNVVIENCDISAWGSSRSGNFGNSCGAITLTTNNVKIIIQRNKLHNPSYDANNWSETVNGDNHPYGPCGMTLGAANKDSNGRIIDNGCWNTVVRYNEVYSGSASLDFEDGIQCAPPDGDEYCNKVSDINDNGFELETGGDRNVRVWGNYVYNVYNAYSAVPVHIGPLYVFRNISDKYHDDGASNGSRPYKVGGNSYSGTWYETAATKGASYWYHNVTLQADADDGFQSADGGPLYLVSRNNIIFVKNRSIIGCSNSTNSFDYDLYNKSIDVTESHGVSGSPTWASGSGPDGGAAAGYYQLASNSSGYDKGVVLPNFNDGYSGSAPDIGVQEAGAPKMEFGVNAYTTLGNNYTLTVNNVGTGSVTLDPSGGTYASGTVVTLTATAGSGYTFGGWSGALSGSVNPTTITMNSNNSVTANFTSTGTSLVTNLSVQDGTNAADWSIQSNIQVGSVLFGDRTYLINSLPSAYLGLDWIRPANDSKSYNSDPLVTFNVTSYATVYVLSDDRITSKPGWMSGWVDTGDNLIDNESTAVTYSIFKKDFAANSLVSLGNNNGGSTATCQYAIMVKATIPPVNYTLTTATSGLGSLALNPAGGTYVSGTVVTITATADSGNQFSSWSGDLSGSANPTTLTMDANKSITANFTALPTYTLVTTTNGNGSVTSSPSGGTYVSGTVITLSAVPNTGYQFSNWTGDLSGTSNPATITMNSNKNITATFTAIPAHIITNLSAKDATNAADWSIQANLQQGDVMYGDRTFTITTLPTAYAGLDWIRSANDSKNATANPLVTFAVAADADVFVAYNDAISTKSSWITTWTDTGDNLVSSDGGLVFSIYKATYAANSTVSLGVNATGSGSIDTYIVMAKASAVKSSSLETNAVSGNGYQLAQNYPNPFQTTTNIKYSIPENCHVKISVYNLQGQLVKTLVDEDLEAGEYSTIWNGDGKSGSNVAVGTYFYKMETQKVNLVKKVFLLK